MLGVTHCAVLGDPVGHSLSPVLHRAGYAALGLTGWEYDARRVPAGSLASVVGELDASWRGLSVTAPLKREALALGSLASLASPLAVLAGGANTLVRRDGGWAADNTDVPGAVAAIRERYDGALATATVLGGGATAASVGLALAELGVASITLAVRDPARAATAAAAVRAHPAGPSVAIVGLAQTGPADVVVSTVPVGAQTPDLVARVLPAPVVFEVTYNVWPTPLVSAAASASGGAVIVSGLDLLVHQAVLQFEQFTGVPGPLAAMRAAGEAALAARG